MKLKLLLFSLLFFSSFSALNAQHSIARDWNEELLHAIRNDFARPTVHARNLFHTSAAMYDSWAIFDDQAETFLLGKTVDGFTCPFDGFAMPADIEAAREEILSYAVYRIMRNRFQNSPGAGTIIPAINQKFFELGYDQNYADTDYSTGNPAALGNYIAECYINFGLQDNSNQQGNYNNTSYAPINSPLVTNFPGNSGISDPNHWQPLTLDVFIDQSGNEIPFNTPPFLSPEWGQVTPFALQEEDLTIHERDGFEYWVYHDPGTPPQLDTNMITESSEQYKWGNALVAVWSSHLDPTIDVMVDISPASYGNLPNFPTDFTDYPDFYDLINGGDPSQGHDLNPATGMPYEPQMVPLGDYARVLAEFWADGPDSETPPGHWFTILNYVNDHPQFEKRFRGQGEILSDLEWDIKAYFLLGGTMHDAAITAWGCKGWYDYIRPISALRYMADLGQSSDPNLPSYHVGGIPLIDGKIELVTGEDPFALEDPENVGKIKVMAWRGPDFVNDPATDYAGVDWILLENWWPYQRPSFVTPNFAGYVSGHSTFSRAAAEMMTLLTGDEFFPGGMAEFFAPQNEFLVFEEGPSMDITLQWATYRDASDQTSLSRIWGGIHPPADDIPGRLMGYEVGIDAFHLAEQYFYRDDDMDGYLSNVDCNDNDPTINPGASEICDGIDQNCNGANDEGIPKITYFLDSDSDGFGDAAMTVDTCIMTPPTGYVDNDMDCDDTNAAIHPNATEICDDIDNNCSGMADDNIPYYTYYLDSDGDTFGDAANAIEVCLATPPANYVTNDADCDDLNPAIHPDATEICDNIDNNCSGGIDDNIPYYDYYLDNDADGFGDAANAINICEATPPTNYVTNDLDCNDADANIHPDATETCDDIDNDCNGEADDNIPYYTYYFDADNDAFGNAADSIVVCADTPPAGYVVDNTDCNDDASNIFPTAVETADNGVDEDCSGLDLFLQTKIFPNPSNGEITIHLAREGEVLCRLTATDGRFVEEFPITFASNRARVRLNNLPQGIYFIELLTTDGERLLVDKLMRN